MTYSPMGTIGSATLLWGLVDLDALDDEIRSVETLGICVRFGVSEEIENELGGFNRPAGARDTELLSCATDGSAPACLFLSYLSHLFPSQGQIKMTPISSCDKNRVAPSNRPPQLTLRSPPNTSSVPPHRNSLLVRQNILQVGNSASELPSVDGLSSLTGVLEGYAEVGTAGAGRFGGLDLGGCVAYLRRC